MSLHVAPASSNKAGAMPSLCAPVSFRHYRRSTTSKAPRKRTFLVTMTKYNPTCAAPAGVYAHNIAMLSCGVCCDNINYEIPCGDNGNGNGNIGKNNNNGGNNNNGNGPQSFGSSDDGFGRFLQFFGNALLRAVALIATVAAFPAGSNAAMATFAAGARTKAFPIESSLSPSTGRPRSKVLHVPCKGSTLVVPLSDPQAAASLPAGQRRKIVDASIELSNREVAIINRHQYCVRESMRV